VGKHQGLKPKTFRIQIGTTEVVPLHVCLRLRSTNEVVPVHVCLRLGSTTPERQEPSEASPVHTGLRSALLSRSSDNPGAEMEDLSESGGGGRSPFLLEAFPAKHGTTLRRLKRNRSFLATLGTGSTGFHLGIGARGSDTQGCRPFCFTRFAPLRLVLELLIVKEELFPSREDEVSTAIDTLEDLVLEFHGKSSLQPRPLRAEGAEQDRVPSAQRAAKVSGSLLSVLPE